MAPDKRLPEYYIEDEVKQYIQHFREQGYSYAAIEDGLLRSGVPNEVIKRNVALDKVKGKFLLSKRGFVLLLSTLIALIIIFGVLLLSLWPERLCQMDANCESGYFCSNGACVKSIGALDCEKLADCDLGYDCYKCLETMI